MWKRKRGKGDGEAEGAVDNSIIGDGGRIRRSKRIASVGGSSNGGTSEGSCAELQEEGHDTEKKGEKERIAVPVDGVLHPLYIPHIAENILKDLVGYMGHCESSACATDKCLRGLMNARMVCKAWSDAGLRIFRSKCDIIVFGEYDAPDTKKMTDFLADMENTNDIPYQKFRFEPAFFVQKNEHLFKNFLYSFGSSLVHLKLWFDNDCKVRFPKRALKDLRLDSLKYLFFGCVNYKGRTSSENLELTYLLEALLPNANSLKQFCFSFPPKDLKSQNTIITRFGDIVSQKLPPSVNNLKLEMKLSSDQFNSLAELDLRLETFHCDFRGSAVEQNVLNKMFESMKNSLQEMRLLDSELKYNFKLEFPSFRKLSVLEIQGGEVMPFNFKSAFPALERLILYGWSNIETLKTFLSVSTPCLTLGSLELPYKICDPGIVIDAAKCFPNVTHLEVSPINGGVGAMEQIFARMTGLKELDITFPFIIEEAWDVDPLFTGIAKTDFDMLLDEWDQQCNNFTFHRSRPSIVNLRKLEKLTIQDHSDEIVLTDITAQFAFLKMDRLKCLEIGKFGISDRLFSLIGQKYKLTRSYDSESEPETESSVTSSEEEPNGQYRRLFFQLV